MQVTLLKDYSAKERGVPVTPDTAQGVWSRMRSALEVGDMLSLEQEDGTLLDYYCRN